MLSAYWPDPKLPFERQGWITRRLTRFNDWFMRRAEDYKQVIAWALDHRMSMVIISVGTFFASFTLATKGLLALVGALAGIFVMAWAAARSSPVVKGVGLLGGLAMAFGLVALAPVFKKVGTAFFPIDDRSEFNIKIETPPGSSLQYTRAKAEHIQSLVQRYPEVEYSYTTLGGGTSGAVDVGTMYVRLMPKADRERSAEAVAAEARRELAQYAGFASSVSTQDFGQGRKQLALNVRGNDRDAINATAELIRAQVAQVPDVVDLALSSKGQKPELNVEINRGLAGALGITVGQVAQSIRPAFAGIDAGDWEDPSGAMRDVRVRLAPEYRQRVTDLARLPLVVTGPDGRATTFPLGQVAEITQSLGPAVINHLNRDLNVAVEWNVSGRSTGEVMQEVQARIAGIRLPPGIGISAGLDQEFQDETFASIGFSLVVAVLLMYLVLVMQFGSFMDPLAIMASLPLSLIGVMLSLSLAGYTINIMSLIGIILLIGLVAKNAILLIDFAKWAQEERGIGIREALIEAGGIRLRPILMTTFALIAGMLPIALGTGEGAQSRAPLGVAIIGGVMTSTLLTLLVIPTFYEIMFEWRQSVMAFFGRKRAGHTDLTPPAGAVARETT
jgi:HAE1 family hydrophobic/amphiphilic exporter-1